MMHLSLPPRLEALVAEIVKSGRYASVNDAVGAALRMLQEHEEKHRLAVERLKAEVAKAEAEIAAGKALVFDSVDAAMEHLERR
jgi:putative addiction module CopG family antidote